MADDHPSHGTDGRRRGRWLSRWMIGVGVVYLLFAVNLSSFVVAPDRVYQFFPTYDAPLDSVAFAVAADVALMAGLTHGVLGAFLLWASRRPTAHVGLVPLIIAIELVVGIADDLYMITMRTYTVDAVYYGFIVLHLLIILTGIAAYRGVDGSSVRWNSADGRAP